MKTFIKVTEIWIPDKERTQLEFGSGLYGGLHDFKAASEQQQFAYNEGLPGKAWAAGHPIVLTKFEYSYFKRTAAAKKAGLTCGIAIPVFSGDFLMAVVVFLCGDDEEHAGAIEVWCNNPISANTLNVMDGYYGTLQHFEAISRQLNMPKGQGLAGLAWATGMPILIDDISKAATFIRASDAQQAGISMGIGIPVSDTLRQTYIMTFLSAKATPIAKRIQLWIPDRQGKQLICQQGYSKNSNDLAKIFETITVNKGVGAIGRVWLTGMPVISGNHESSNYNPELDNLSSMLALPVIEKGRLKAIVSFLF
ncbi:GAF domain-containing protein [Crenothrix sp.]|uniref:GAF domain-containing protein n=1 Tax=Crenothrix sp. TaxID=3100433 RepID=UPI00374C9A7A